jgi:phage tail-like protein
VTNTVEILASSKYYLEITLSGSTEVIDGYFMECSGFKRTLDVIEIAEVTPQVWGKDGNTKGRVVRTKIPGNAKMQNIILKQGLCISSTFWSWLNQVEAGNWATQQRDGDLTVYDQGAAERARFRFNGAWPVSYKVSDFRASGNEFAIVEIELSVREFLRVTSSASSPTTS